MTQAMSEYVQLDVLPPYYFMFQCMFDLLVFDVCWSDGSQGELDGYSHLAQGVKRVKGTLVIHAHGSSFNK